MSRYNSYSRVTGIGLGAAVIAVCLFLVLGSRDSNSREPAAGDDKNRIDSMPGVPDKNLFRLLKVLHREKTKPKPGDWLSCHKEPGQTFYEYVRINPERPDKKRRKIYISLLGDFDAERKKIIKLTAEYMKIYFSLPVEFRKPFSLDTIPDRAQRIHPVNGVRQVLTGYVLDNLLKPRIPKDAFCYIAFTSSDLWPGKGWNFVFGQASLRERVGVWSIYRNGSPSESEKMFRLCLKRTIKTGVHETGHILSIYHCTAYECCMNGSNHRQESDSQPLWLCPVCLRKLCYAVQTDPEKRYKKLAEFCSKNGFAEENTFFQKSLAIIQKARKERIRNPGHRKKGKVNAHSAVFISRLRLK